jgi:hypothetical protein
MIFSPATVLTRVLAKAKRDKRANNIFLAGNELGRTKKRQEGNNLATERRVGEERFDTWLSRIRPPALSAPRHDTSRLSAVRRTLAYTCPGYAIVHLGTTWIVQVCDGVWGMLNDCKRQLFVERTRCSLAIG